MKQNLSNLHLVPLSEKLIMKFSKLVYGIFALSFLFAGVAHAESRVAYVDADKVVENSPQYEKAREAIQKEFSRREKDILAKAKHLVKQEEKLTRDSKVMSESEAKRLERDILSRRRELKNAKEEFREDLTLRQNESFNKLRRQVLEVIKTVAKEEKLDLVFSVGVVYASSKVDISDKVLAKLRARK